MRIEERLNDLAKAEIEALEAEGIKPTAAEIVQINALGWAIETPETRIGLARGVPVAAGGATLWPLTLYASDWLDRLGAELEAKDEAMAVAYAMAHSYASGCELESCGEEARNAAKAWAKKLRMTPDAIGEAVDQVLSQESAHDLPPMPGEDKPMSVGDFSAFLAATNGGDPEFWERRCSLGYAVAVLAQVVKQNAADGKPTANDPRIVAERAMGYAVEKIRQRAKQEAIHHA